MLAASLPAPLDVPLAADLVGGDPAPWSRTEARDYATQSERPYLNGGFASRDARCGLEGRVIKVTNLDDSGPGSLRAAVEDESGPRTVVFEVSGAIRLQSYINITDPHLTVAGQTAPPPGISLYHEGVNVRTHDVCLQHFRIRIGDRLAGGTQRTEPSNGDLDLDALKILDSRDPTYNIVVDNLSLSWSSDEMLSLYYEDVADVTIRDTLLAEPLNDNLHPRGTHAYCLLLPNAGFAPQRIAVIGNVMAHCLRRAPRTDEGTSAIVNNLIYNPGVFAIHLNGPNDVYSTIVGNVMRFPDDEDDRWQGVPGNAGSVEALVQNVYRGSDTDREVRLHLSGNDPGPDHPVHVDRSSFHDSTTPSEIVAAAEVWDGSIYPLPPDRVEPVILDNVGAFPRHRDAVDERVIDDIRNRTGTYIDSQEEVGGYPDLAENRRALQPPTDPQGDDDGNGISNLVEWLQGFTDAVE